MTGAIHPTAIVDPRARLASGVRVGPYTVIDGDVEVGEGTTIGAHCVLTGHTTIGRDNRIFHFCSVGEANQDKKYRGEPTRLVIGDRNTIREYCSLNRGTAQDRGETTVGNDNWIMAYCHIAHDCVVGDHTVFANNATRHQQRGPQAARLHAGGARRAQARLPDALQVGAHARGREGGARAPGGDGARGGCHRRIPRDLDARHRPLTVAGHPAMGAA
jgi:carbonic anhydrase/acetyltransferase-like protein (isoleucine patch superfamily)